VGPAAGGLAGGAGGPVVFLHTPDHEAHGANIAIDDWPSHTAGGHLLSVVQAATNTELL